MLREIVSALGLTWGSGAVVQALSSWNCRVLLHPINTHLPTSPAPVVERVRPGDYGGRRFCDRSRIGTVWLTVSARNHNSAFFRCINRYSGVMGLSSRVCPRTHVSGIFAKNLHPTTTKRRGSFRGHPLRGKALLSVTFFARDIFSCQVSKFFFLPKPPHSGTLHPTSPSRFPVYVRRNFGTI